MDKLIDLTIQNKLPHAILLVGNQSAHSHSKSFSKYLLCENNTDGEACSKCRSCNLFDAKTHPDLFYISPEEEGKSIKIDQIRSLIESLHQSSQNYGYRIAIINPADAMNHSAQNALLKTLEEPGENTLIVLITCQLEALAPTIRSRCQVFHFASEYQTTEKEAELQAKFTALAKQQLDPTYLARDCMDLPLASTLDILTFWLRQCLHETNQKYIFNVLDKIYLAKRYLAKRISINQQLLLEDIFASLYTLGDK